MVTCIFGNSEDFKEEIVCHEEMERVRWAKGREPAEEKDSEAQEERADLAQARAEYASALNAARRLLIRGERLVRA